jgi:hypothetical protein
MIIRTISRSRDETDLYVSGHPDSMWHESQCVYIEADGMDTIGLTVPQAMALVDALTDAIAEAWSAPHSSTAPERYEAVEKAIRERRSRA